MLLRRRTGTGKAETVPELLEISGLGQEDSGDLKEAGGFLLIMGGSILVLGVLLPALLKSDAVALGLGIIKRCRVKDLKSDRPRRAQAWCLWDSKGKRILGRHPSRTKALRQERLIQVRKHGG
jgi:hypothetical protein